MSLVAERTVSVVVRIPWRFPEHAKAMEVGNWITDALKADGMVPCHGRPFGERAGGRGPNPNTGTAVAWTEPEAELSFKLLDVSTEDAEAAIRRAVQDAPGKIGGVEVNYDDERGAYGW